MFSFGVVMYELLHQRLIMATLIAQQVCASSKLVPNLCPIVRSMQFVGVHCVIVIRLGQGS